MVKYALALATIVCSLSIIFVSLQNSKNNSICTNDAKITFLNVGQGDAILIRSCDNYYALVDTGKDASIINQLELELPDNFSGFNFVLLTHSHADHIAGLPWILSKYNVAQVFWNKNIDQNQLIESNLLILKSHNISPEVLTANTNFNLGCCLNFKVLWPVSDIQSRTLLDPNHASIAVKVEYESTSIYLGGDLDTNSEAKISNQLANTDIIKLSHHGSNTSSSYEFIEKLKPKVAIVSAGINNSYGHPHKTVLQSLSDLKVPYLSTQTNSSITLTLTPNSYCYKLQCVNTQ